MAAHRVQAPVAWLRAALVLSAVVLADQISKALVVARIDRGDSDAVFPGVNLVHVRNRGIAFGLFDGRTTALALLTAGALALLVAYFATHATRPYAWLATGLLLGGALGNVIDRVRDKAVTDFIDLPLWPAFNLADVSITLGIIALLVALESGRAHDPGD